MFSVKNCCELSNDLTVFIDIDYLAILWSVLIEKNRDKLQSCVFYKNGWMFRQFAVFLKV